MLKIQYNPETELWEKRKEPYTTIDVESKEALEYLEQLIARQKSKKPLGVDLYGKANGNIYKYVCPICKIFLLGRRMTREEPSLRPNYCPNCGQKIDWSDVDDTVCNGSDKWQWDGDGESD